MRWEIRPGDWIERLREMPDEHVNCCVTSPPYWGLRDYGAAGQLGLEKTPEEYIGKMVEGFREVRRVLRKDGTLWLNIGDSYASDSKGSGGPSAKQLSNRGSRYDPVRLGHGLKVKDLTGVPWLVAFALRADGWWLRSDIIWSKPDAMPESVKDRPTKAHEYLFLLSKSERYFYDGEAIKEPIADYVAERIAKEAAAGMDGTVHNKAFGLRGDGGCLDKQAGAREHLLESGRNKRSVWEITTSRFPEAHFATFPPKLVEPCILAGCPEGGTVLDPFCGAGTTGMVSLRLQRNFIGIELKQEYIEMARRRIEQDAPLLNQAEVTA